MIANGLMRFLTLFCALCWAQSAASAPLAYQGSLTVQFLNFPRVVTGAGSATVNGAAPLGGPIVGLGLTGNVFSTTSQIVDLTDPGASPIEGLQLTVSAGSGSFAGSPLGGLLSLSGVLKVCLFMDCTVPAVAANLSLPLGAVGVGGTSTISSFVNVTVTGSPWTTGTVNIGSTSQMGFVHGPLSATSSAATVGGSIRMVTPILVATDIGVPTLPTFAILDLTFVPEPTTALLLGAGVVALALRGRHASPGRRSKP